MVTGSLVKCERCEGRGYIVPGYDMASHLDCGPCDSSGKIALPVEPLAASMWPEWLTFWIADENEENET